MYHEKAKRNARRHRSKAVTATILLHLLLLGILAYQSNPELLTWIQEMMGIASETTAGVPQP